MLIAHRLRAASACAIFAFAGLGGRHMPVLAPPDAGGGNGSPEKEMLQLAKDFKVACDEVKTFAEKADVEIKKNGKLTEETKAASDKALSEMNTISARLTEVEQKIVRRGGEGQAEHKSIGQTFVDSEQFKAAAAQGDRFKGKIDVEVKNITSASVSGTSATTALGPADRRESLGRDHDARRPAGTRPNQFRLRRIRAGNDLHQ